MLKIAICDTSKSNRNLISGFCNKFFRNKVINYKIQEYTSGETLLAEVFPDILFLDTALVEMDGILVKDILGKMHANTKIVFVSNQLEKMSQAFGKNVYGFEKKPMKYEKFYEFMTSILSDIDEERDCIFCKHNREIERIFLKDILYVRAYGKYTKVYLYGRKNYRLCDRCFGEWYLEMENREFLCCHRSYLVNLCFIKNIRNKIELINGEEIPLSEKKKKEFWDSYKAYIRRIKNGPANREIYSYMES